MASIRVGLWAKGLCAAVLMTCAACGNDDKPVGYALPADPVDLPPLNPSTQIEFAGGPEIVLPKWEGPNAEADRNTWIQSQVESLAFPGWEGVEGRLVMVGKPCLPAMIRNLSRRDPVYRSRRAGFAVAPNGADETYELGDLVHSMLVNIVAHSSNYPGDATKLPSRRDAAGWGKWYLDHGSQIEVGHRR